MKFPAPVLFLIVSGGLAVSPLCHGEPTDPPPDYDTLEAQIEMARVLRPLQLSSEQIHQWQNLAHTVAEAQKNLKNFRARADVLEAVRKVRDAAVAGAPEDSLWTAFEPFQEESDRLEAGVNDALTQGARAAMEKLTPTQMSRLILSQIQAPMEVMEELADHRGNKPNDWQEWREEKSQQLASQIVAAPKETSLLEVKKSFAHFFDRMRNLPTDDFFEKRENLTREFRGLYLDSISQNLSEDQHESVRSQVQEWLGREGLVRLLDQLKKSLTP